MRVSLSKSDRAIIFFKNVLPSPLSIAIVLTLITIGLAQIYTKPVNVSNSDYFLQIITSWEKGLWDNSAGGLYFAFQMMLILVLGHILALTPLADKIIQQLLKYCKTTSSSAVIVSIGAITLGLINWGLGLVFGAIIARKVGEKFARDQKPLNYGLIGAAAYSTMMTWHSGFSGSATTKSMESGYIPAMMKQVNVAGNYPDSVPFVATIGSTMNISLTLLCLLLIPLMLYWVGKKTEIQEIPYFESVLHSFDKSKIEHTQGAERLDFSKVFGICLGVAIVIFGIYKAITYNGSDALGFMQLNFINFMFLGLSLIFHKNIYNFSNALQTAIGDVSGILIQFPLYFGILAIMNSSGLIILISNAITSFSTAYTLPEFTFLSAGLINFFVPSGGGQWAIQGPIIIETTQRLNADLSKTILAMAYGDQLTNMLQPFWALPLLGITKLKPQQLLPYSALVCLLGLLIFGIGLLVF